MADAVDMLDGTLDFGGGVNSIKVTTAQSQQNPNGLSKNESSWLNNATVRDGGISPRSGWFFKGRFHDGSALFQGKFLYEPIDGSDPYHICSIGGRIFQVFPDFAVNPVDLSAVFGLTNPPLVEHAYFCQGEEFLVIQSGDGVTLPLFWNGTTLRRSVGILANSGLGLISTDNQSFNIPGMGQSVVLSWTSVAGLAVKDTVQIQTHGSSVSWGTYTVTAINALALTLMKSDPPNTSPGSVSGSMDLFKSASANTSELPAALAMDYYMGRLWYNVGKARRNYGAGDIVGGPSGTIAYNFRDSILKVTENPLVIGGDGFSVPDNSGNIRALKHNASLDAALGQGQLFIFTRKAVYALTVPVSRSDWIAATSQNQPLQVCVQLANGAVNDRSIVAVNGDLFYQSLEPGIRSLISAIRYFNQWGNKQISANERRVLQFCDRALLHMASGVTFDSRLLQSSLPKRLPQGVVHQAIVPMDFIPVSSFGADTSPIWEGMYEGLDFLQLTTGNFGGLERCFGAVVSREDSSIELWELTQDTRFDNNVHGEARITFIYESPAFTWGQEFLLKKMVSAELWIDRLFGDVEFTLEWRPDSDPCWQLWHKWKQCSARSCAEDVNSPCGYPATGYGESYRSTMTLPVPPKSCATATGRPSNIGYQMQVRLTVKGATRIRGLILHAQPVERRLYQSPVC